MHAFTGVCILGERLIQFKSVAYRKAILRLVIRIKQAIQGMPFVHCCSQRA